MFRKNFYTTFIYIALISFAIVSCKKEKAPEVDPNTLPIANFSYEILYKTHDKITYAHVKATNNSSFSNRWKWNRVGSIGELSGAIEFTTNRDTAVTQIYVSTKEEQEFEIRLIAYSDIVISPDSIRTFESHPFVQVIKIKNP